MPPKVHTIAAPDAQEQVGLARPATTSMPSSPSHPRCFAVVARDDVVEDPRQLRLIPLPDELLWFPF